MTQRQLGYRLGSLVLLCGLPACGVATSLPGGPPDTAVIHFSPTNGDSPAGTASPDPTVPGTPQAPVPPPPGGQGSVVGAVGGRALTPRSVSVAWATLNGRPVMGVRLSDQADDCDLMGKNTQRQRSSNLLLVVYADTGQVVPGTYVITSTGAGSGTGRDGMGDFQGLGAACLPLVSAGDRHAISGSVTLSRVVMGTSAAGTFVLGLGGGDNIEGTFNASACAALPTFVQSALHFCD